MLISQARVNQCHLQAYQNAVAAGGRCIDGMFSNLQIRITLPTTHNLAFGLHPFSGSILLFTCFLSRYKNLACKILDAFAFFSTVSLSSSDKGPDSSKNFLSTAFPLLERRGATYSRHHCLLPTAALVVGCPDHEAQIPRVAGLALKKCLCSMF